MQVAIIVLALAIPLAALAGYFIRKVAAKSQADSAEAKVQETINEAKSKAQSILLEAKEKALAAVETAKKEEQQRLAQLVNSERRIERKEEQVERMRDEVEKKHAALVAKADEIRAIRKQTEELHGQQVAVLEKSAAMSKDEAQAVLLERIEKEYQEKLLSRIKKLEEAETQQFEERARNIVALAIQRIATEVAQERTATLVEIPNDEVKGRIIGKEGRNIKTFEKLTGTEIVVDETPGSIIISGFNPIRRHVAKLALEKLIVDGRIHPTRIEEMVQAAKQEIAQKIKEAGRAAVYELGLTDFDPKLVQLIGRLMFRTSYGQNVLQHSIEAAHMARIMADEIGADARIVKAGALLHDIGKAVDHEIQGGHADISVNICQKFGLDPRITHAVEAHHGDIPARTPEAVIVQVAEAISAARPGARRDSYEEYIKKLEGLENIANSFTGVEKSFAIQAGREVRVIVRAEDVDDIGAHNLAKQIAEKIEKEMTYPGEIKVNVLRETRAVEYAR